MIELTKHGRNLLRELGEKESRTPQMILDKALSLYSWYQSHEGSSGCSGDAGIVYYAHGADPTKILSRAKFQRGTPETGGEYHLAERVVDARISKE